MLQDKMFSPSSPPTNLIHRLKATGFKSLNLFRLPGKATLQFHLDVPFAVNAIVTTRIDNKKLLIRNSTLGSLKN